MQTLGRRTFLKANAAALGLGALPSRLRFLREPDQVSYQLRYDADNQGQLVVTIMPPAKAGATDLVFPRSIPMGYGVASYDSFVDAVRGWSTTGEQLPVARLEGPRWRVGREGATIARIRYVVDLTRMEQRTLAASDSSKARYGYLGLLGYSVLGYLDGLEALPVQIQMRGPVGWPAFTTLEPRVEPWPGEQAVSAANYYAAADAQILLGPSLQVRQLAGVRPLFLAAYVEAPADLTVNGALVEDAFGRVSDWFASVPFPHYTAMVEYLRPVSSEHQYGFSMEHLESSTYFLDTTQALFTSSPVEARERARFNYAHHIAHSWIPKRLYGEGYFPHRWEVAPVIDTIWFSEGFGRWVAIEALAAALPDQDRPAWRGERLGRLAATLASFPALFHTTPLVQLSRVGSTQYSTDFRIGQSLFCRGALLADELDTTIRQHSPGNKSLRDSIRWMVVWAAREGRGFKVEELPRLIGEPVGVDVGSVFAKWLA